MKFSTPLVVLATITGAYSLVIGRDTPVKKVINDVTDSLKALDTAANSFDGDIQPVVDAADGVINTINNGQQVADGAPPIGLGDAATLLDPVKALDAQAKTLFNDVKGRVPDVEKAKQCDVTREKLSTVNSTGTKLIDTILNKVSSTFAKKQAQPYVDDIKKVLSDAQDLFAEGNCVNAS